MRIRALLSRLPHPSLQTTARVAMAGSSAVTSLGGAWMGTLAGPGQSALTGWEGCEPREAEVRDGTLLSDLSLQSLFRLPSDLETTLHAIFDEGAMSQRLQRSYATLLTRTLLEDRRLTEKEWERLEPALASLPRVASPEARALVQILASEEYEIHSKVRHALAGFLISRGYDARPLQLEPNPDAVAAVIRSNVTEPDVSFHKLAERAGVSWWDPLESTCRHASLSIL